MEYFRVIEACIRVASTFDGMTEFSIYSLDEVLSTINYSLSYSLSFRNSTKIAIISLLYLYFLAFDIVKLKYKHFLEYVTYYRKIISSKVQDCLSFISDP